MTSFHEQLHDIIHLLFSHLKKFPKKKKSNYSLSIHSWFQLLVFQYLGTKKYLFIHQILILTVFTELILILILKLIILNFILKYWKILSIFQYQNRMFNTLGSVAK